MINVPENKRLLSAMEQIVDPLPIPMILVDKNSKIIMINDVFADYLGYKKADLIGKHVLSIDKNSRFPYVLKTKKAEIAKPHHFQNGHTAIVHRIPVMDDSGEVIYGFGLVLFENIDAIKEVIQHNKQLNCELFRIRNKLRKIIGAKYSFDMIIGSSDIMVAAKTMGKKAAMTSSNILLLGESGTGKELFAHAIHNESGRSYEPFIKVNCAAIPKELLEAELFGYEEGAFTGAKKGGNIGKFEQANHGTIFLDEIGDMSMDMQVKILRVLQEREFERIGGTETLEVDLRIIAATNRDLPSMIKNSKFREDLYYRINVMTIRIPPLRDRKSDIPNLVDDIVKKLSNSMGRYISGYDAKFMDKIIEHHWPGNVRELENAIERAINMSEKTTLESRHLPKTLQKTAKFKSDMQILTLSESLYNVEKEAIREALEHYGNNKSKAALALGIARSTLYEKMKKFGWEA